MNRESVEISVFPSVTLIVRQSLITELATTKNIFIWIAPSLFIVIWIKHVNLDRLEITVCPSVIQTVKTISDHSTGYYNERRGRKTTASVLSWFQHASLGSMVINVSYSAVPFVQMLYVITLLVTAILVKVGYELKYLSGFCIYQAIICWTITSQSWWYIQVDYFEET